MCHVKQYLHRLIFSSFSHRTFEGEEVFQVA